jgi:hypothetical protein
MIISVQCRQGKWEIRRGDTLDAVLEPDTWAAYHTQRDVGWVRTFRGLRRCSQAAAKEAAAAAIKAAELAELCGEGDPFNGDDPFWYDYVPDSGR